MKWIDPVDQFHSTRNASRIISINIIIVLSTNQIHVVAQLKKKRERVLVRRNPWEFKRTTQNQWDVLPFILGHKTVARVLPSSLCYVLFHQDCAVSCGEFVIQEVVVPPQWYRVSSIDASSGGSGKVLIALSGQLLSGLPMKCPRYSPHNTFSLSSTLTERGQKLEEPEQVLSVFTFVHDTWQSSCSWCKVQTTILHIFFPPVPPDCSTLDVLTTLEAAWCQNGPTT